MTGQEFSEVDFDLLADYVGGALDGTPEEAVVARRVAEEPAWAEAHAALVEATGSVRASLASWGDSAEPMPVEVADRIATALEQEPRRPDLTAVPDEQAGPRRTAPRPRRRMPAWAAPAAIAAGVAALAGLGWSQAGNIGGGGDDSSAGSAEEAPAVARQNADDAGVAPFAGREIPLTSSGQDYRAGTFGTGGSPPKAAMSSATAMAEQEGDRAGAAAAPAPVLARLRDPAALAMCVEAIGREHQPGVTEVEVVDLASYEGSPAAIVFFTDGTGARWVWAAGPDCGLAQRGADTRDSAKIG
ncbi:hypothetical protein RB614_21245 [Phytohabitans sp. ZYX-F-186]|uniref:Anti-sigma factor n=1 Tax=Phytohabitans maris TaxID=3071409 RepID=A0ABU0ZKI0_9ACTN|nr:hypothetical protein [Phytohabitans sp. ZYX-F-186]MDQ7907041.1 hypothetical protein [Phytohabitans sp. ZYX-F-186]